jgi:hypothetical protein
MKKISMFLAMSAAMHFSDMRAQDFSNQDYVALQSQEVSLRQQLLESQRSVFDWVQYYRSYAQIHGMSEQTFFMNLAESCAFNEATVLQTTTAEHDSMQELREFYMTLAFAYEEQKEDLVKSFVTRFQEISQTLNAMSHRLRQ